MPTLDELQRQWLDNALKNKGRFTRKSSVESDWEDYRRRRDKAAQGGAGLLPDDPQKKLVDAGLQAADKLAEKGKFAEAYKSLDAIKKIGASASKERAKAVSLSDLNVRLNILRSNIEDVISLVDFAIRHYDPILDRLRNLEPCSAKADLREASLRRLEIANEEQIAIGERQGREGWVYKAYTQLRKHDCHTVIEDIERDIAVHVGAGNGNAVREHANRAAQLRARLFVQDRRYSYPDYSVEIVNSMKAAIETEFRRLKDISRFKPDLSGVSPDDQKTTEVRDKLEPTANLDWIEEEEQARLEKAKFVMRIGKIKDDPLAGQTVAPEVKLAPELKKFDGGQIFDHLTDGIFGVGVEVPDDIPVEKAEAIKTQAIDGLKRAIANLDPDSDQMFDLMLMTPEELMQMCNLQLTGIDSPNGVSESHKLLLKQLGDAMRKEILASSPNKMKDDNSEITINGQVFTLVDVVGEGANGAIRRYTDGKNTFVVKTLKGSRGGDDEKFQAMRDEMRTHRQVMGGQDDGVTDTDNIVQMHGAALSDDGSIHMMMEDVEGGDMSTVGNNMLLMKNLGVLPEEARMALSIDLLVQTVKGMQAMQERGLVHNDLKPQNMMINKDGTVKIIDFGESRFVDEDTGLIEKAKTGGYNTTAGYESPEHWGGKNVKGVDSKADTFALGGIVKTMMDPAMSESATSRRPEGVSALGRLVSLLNDEDPKKRPSLDAVLTSSLLDQLQQDANPEDVKDLQKAMSEMNMVMKDLTGKVSGDDFNDRRPQGKGMTDVLWFKYEQKIAKGEADVPLSVMQTMPTKIDDAIRELQKEMASGNKLESASDNREKLARYEDMKKFWLQKIDENVTRQREEGKAELDKLLEDEWTDVYVPGPGGGERNKDNTGGNMTAGQAKKRKDANIQQIKLIQADFYALSMKDPTAAQDAMAETNRRLKELDDQNRAIDEAIFGLLGPKGKYFVTEQKLSEIAARFGPRKVTGEEISDKATPKKKTEGEEEGDLPPLPEDKIPDPPPMPEEKKKVN